MSRAENLEGETPRGENQVFELLGKKSMDSASVGKEARKVFDWGWKGGEGGCFGIGSEEVREETAAGGGACGARAES